MRPLPANRVARWFLFFLSLFAFDAQAIGERLIDDIMRSDFIFAKSQTNVPFFQIGQLQYTHQDSYTLRGACKGEDCEFNYKNISQDFGMPVWVGQKNMFVLGESLEYDAFQSDQVTAEFYSAGLLAAWLGQPTEHWQYGVFVYAWRGIGSSVEFNESPGSVIGGVGRYAHRETFHSYWGLVRFEEAEQAAYYPYAGFDWYLGEHWSISAVIPWPTVSYAPNNKQLLQAGLLISGSSWLMSEDGRLQSSDFEAWDLGLSYAHRLNKLLWLQGSIGYSGVGRVSMTSSAKVEYQDHVEGTPFFRLAINLRPAVNE